MPDRKSLVSTLWLTSSLALLASVLVATIRTSEFNNASSRPDGLRRDFALPPVQATIRLGAAMGTDALQQVNALSFEIEEQDQVDAPGESRITFLVPSSLPKVPDRQSIAPRPIRSHYPLRC